IVPREPQALTISHTQLGLDIRKFQQQLANLGIGHGDAVSIALLNSYEFAISFLATTNQRAIAAPLNPQYKQDEFEFYISDLTSKLILVPNGAFSQDAPAVRAAKKFGAAVA